MGFQWIDPCEDWGDHDLHWQISSEGVISWLTPVGKYTILRLRLHRREWLKNHWKKISKLQQKYNTLTTQILNLQSLLTQKTGGSVEIANIQQKIEDLTFVLLELREELEPPVFTKPSKQKEA